MTDEKLNRGDNIPLASQILIERTGRKDEAENREVAGS